MRFIINFAVIFLMVLALTSTTAARRPESGRVEFAILAGLGNLKYENPSGNDDTESYLGIPSGSGAFPLASMLRISFWTESPLVTDLGVSILNVNDGDDIKVVNLEGGISAAFGESDANTFPFGGVLIGIISLSNDNLDTGRFIGFQGGIRHFFRPHAATRMQVVYRNFIGGDLNLKSSLEISVGLSFLI